MNTSESSVLTSEYLERTLAAAAGKTALVIGDIMLDRCVYGTVNRMSPECSTAPVLDVKKREVVPGGAANVVMNLKAFGCRVHTLSVIGDDAAGRELAALLEEKRDLYISKDRPTTQKTRCVGGGGYLLRVDEEIRAPVDETVQAFLLEQAQKHIAAADVMILSDYNKGVLTPALIPQMIALAKKHDVPVLVDPKKSDYSVYKEADAITPNRKELGEASGMSVENEEEICKAAASLMDTYGFPALVVTRSEEGMSVFEAGKKPVHIVPEAQAVVSVSGAGDTAIAGIAAGLAIGEDLPIAAMLANKACAQVVGKAGTTSVDLKELQDTVKYGPLKNAISETTGSPHQAPLLDWAQAEKQIAAWKRQGLRVGFTNGCFDILHYGHVTYLNRARARCDRLVMGLNHDKSVKILKGPKRPLHDEESRAAVIGALGAIDMVVLFGAEKAGEDNTPCALIEKIKPDIFFKGGDYTLDQLPEAKVMAAIGGITDIMPLYEGHSTTSTLEKMKQTGTA